MIKNLTPSLPEVGKIKIGFKGAEITSRNQKKFQPPKKLDHFIITGLERGNDGNFIKNADIHAKVGEKPKELDIRLLYDDPNLNFLTRYACYEGTKLWCTGDGECASRLTGSNGQRAQVKCPCEHLEQGYKDGAKCKPSGVLSVMLDESPIVGGVWKLRTTSFNSVTNILSSMAMISRITGGVLAGIPLKLTFGKKTTTVPGTEQQTTIPIIGLVYKGSVRELAESGQRTALEFAGYRKRIEYIEDIARKQLDKEMGLGIYTEAETDEDIVAEFYPEQVGATGSAGEPETLVETKSFEDLINASITDSNLLPLVDKFVAASAKALDKPPEVITAMAAENFTDFLNQFNGWVKKNAAPGEQPAAKAETKKTEDLSSGGDAKIDETAKYQGPQPSPSVWDPYTAAVQLKYFKEKSDIIKAECEKLGINIAGLLPREAHGLLLDSVKAEQEADNNGEQQPDDTGSVESGGEEQVRAQEEKDDPFAGNHHPDCNCQECQQAKAHKKLLDEREAKRKALYAEKEEAVEMSQSGAAQTDKSQTEGYMKLAGHLIKGDDFDENAPQKMADDPKPVSKEDLRNRYIATLEQAGKIDRSAWMKSKQQVGIMSAPNVYTMPIEKLIEWATLAQSMVEGEKGFKF